MVKCRQCGTDVDERSVFCHRCGARLAGEEVAALNSDPAPSQDPPESPAENAAPASGPASILRPDPRNVNMEERDLWEGTISSRAMIPTWVNLGLVTVAFLVLAIWLAHAWLWWGLVPLALLWLYFTGVNFYRRWSVRYRLTSRRFFHEQGILRRRIDCIQVIDIEDIDFEQSLVERFLRLGTIHLRSKDMTHPVLYLRGIDNAKDLFTLVDRARQDEQIRRGLRLETV